MGVDLPDSVSQSQHTGPNYQSEPTTCFWGSGFIELGSEPLVQGTEESVADNKREVYEK